MRAHIAAHLPQPYRVQDRCSATVGADADPTGAPMTSMQFPTQMKPTPITDMLECFAGIEQSVEYSFPNDNIRRM